MAIDTIFRSDETFTQRTFRRWVDGRPPSDIHRYELVAGRIVMTPPAGWLHGRVEARIGSLLERHVARHGLGIVFGSSVGYDLPSGDTLEPDASFVSSKRFAATPPGRSNEFLRAVPDLVVEILSPSTAKRDRIEKRGLYAANGVDEYWVVDPDRRAVTVFRRDEGGFDAGRTVIAGIVRSRVLPKLRVSVPKLFQG